MPHTVFNRLLILCTGFCGLLSACDANVVEADSRSTQPAAGDIQESWPIFRGNAALHGVAAGALPDDPSLLWTFETGGAIVSSPVVMNGRVYVGSDDGKLYAIDFATGEPIWEFETEYEIEAPPVVHDGRVFVGASDFFFYAVDAQTGEELWKYETGDRILGGANVVVDHPDGRVRVIVGSYDARLYCFDAETGDVLWEFETLDRINGTPALADGQIFFGGCDTALYVVSYDGELLHKIEIGEECFIAASVAVRDNRVYLGHHLNEVIAVDVEKDLIDWAYSHPTHGFFSAPAVSEHHVVVGGRDSAVHCLDRANGAQVWRFPVRRKVDGSPVICGGRVVVGSGDGRLYMIDLSDGREVWSYDIGKSIFSSPAIVEDTILIGANDGVLYAFGRSHEAKDRP